MIDHKWLCNVVWWWDEIVETRGCRFESHGLVDLYEKNVQFMVVGTCAKNVRLVLVALT